MHQEQGRASLRPFFKRLMDAVRANKRLELAIYGGVILIVALFYIGGLNPKRQDKQAIEPASAQSGTDNRADLETRLKNVLGSIRGAGHVEVLITYESGTELITAMSTNVNSNRSETSDGSKTSTTTQTTEVSQPATVNGGSGSNEPIVLLEKEPVVRGVIVVAEGAADIRVKLDLQRAVTAVLNIPVSKIEVFELSAVQP